MLGRSPSRRRRRHRPFGRGECAQDAGLGGPSSGPVSGGGWAAAGRGPPMAAVAAAFVVGRPGRWAVRGVVAPQVHGAPELGACAGAAGEGSGKMAGVSRSDGGGGHLRAGPSHLPPRRRVQAAANFRPRLPGPHGHSCHRRPPPASGNIGDADSELRKDLGFESPGRWDARDAHSLHTEQLSAVF